MGKSTGTKNYDITVVAARFFELVQVEVHALGCDRHNTIRDCTAKTSNYLHCHYSPAEVTAHDDDQVNPTIFISPTRDPINCSISGNVHFQRLHLITVAGQPLLQHFEHFQSHFA